MVRAFAVAVVVAAAAAAAAAAAHADVDAAVWETTTASSGRAVWTKRLVEDVASPPAYIHVTRPRRLDVWESWDTETIEWSTNAPASDFVRIALYHGNVSPERYLFTIAHAAPNTGSFAWSVPRPPARAKLDALFKLSVELVSSPGLAGLNDGHFRVACVTNCTIVDRAHAFAIMV